MQHDPEIEAIFREETAERLDEVEQILLAIEGGAPPAESVAALFRHAHSIKGNASMVGFPDIAAVAAAIEDTLQAARTAGAVDTALVGPLLRAADAIRLAVAGDPGATAPALAELHAAAGGQTSPARVIPAAPDSSAANLPAHPATERAGDAPTIRVATDKVDRLLDSVGEAVVHRRRLEHLLGDAGGESLQEELDRGDALFDGLQHTVLQLRTLPLSSIVGPFPRAVRDAAAERGKDVRLELSGMDTQLDRVILDGLSEMIVHLLRNAVAHGIEAPAERRAAGKPATGVVLLEAEPRGGMVAISVSDDGRGVSEELLLRAQQEGSLAGLLTEPGFSTSETVDHLSGRGVGLDAVKVHAESLGGSLDVHSGPGQGVTVTLLLPLTLALLHVLLVERGGQAFGFPLGAVVEATTVERPSMLAGERSMELRGASVPLVDLADVLGAAAPTPSDGAPAVVVSGSVGQVALQCDRLLGEHETVVKTLGPMLAGVPGYLGAGILADGSIALIVDPSFAVRGRRSRTAAPDAAAVVPAIGPKVLVVDDQFTVRELQRSILEAAGYRVAVARNGQEALDLLSVEPDVDLVVTDIEMPVLDGYGLLAAVRASDTGSSLPVVMVTSQGDAADRERGAQAGADAYIVKAEFDQQSLLETVRRLVDLS